MILHTFKSNVVIWPQWAMIWKAGVRRPLHLKGLLFHTTADLSITPTCGLLSHFSNCPLGLWCQFFQNLFLVVYLAALYYKEELFTYLRLFVQMFLTPEYDCQTEGRRERSRKSNDSWYVEHPSSVGREVFFFYFSSPSVCVCDF